MIENTMSGSTEFNSERQAEKEIEFLHKNGVEFDDIDVIFRQST